MKLRPTIFLSGVSSEFGSFRDAVEIEVQKKGCFAENQSSFGVDYSTVEEMLRRRINDADAVIHIVGFRFGAEPTNQPSDKPRRSYTQMEYDIARELEKPVYVFLSSDASVCDAPGEDDPEVTALQLAHRQAIKSTNNLRYTFTDKNELCHLAAEIDVVAQADFRVDISRIDKYAPAELVGREDELALLNDAWLKVRRAEPKRPHIITFVALGGEGKTSLVAKWLADLAFQNWPGCDSAFAWSFYSQGTREQYAASSDLFLKEAITFFGDDTDKKFAASAAGAHEKGQRLARIIGQRRALLILDGLEPLQYAPTSPTPGELKDGGITALLKGLAARSDGLCLVTTRYSLLNLKAFWQTTVSEILISRLSQAAGIHLLKTLGVKGSAKEFEDLVEDVKGHALTLNLLGTYLRDAHGGDIRRRNLINLEEADAEEQGGHAFRVIEAYEYAFEEEGAKGRRALAILRLLGLFERPVTADYIGALLEEPAIPGLSDSLIGLNETQRNLVLKRLDDAKLLIVNREGSGALISLDAHPLVREYFASKLREHQLEAWRAAHYRVYEHLRAITPKKNTPTLEDLQPLYEAVAHGCKAERHQEVCQEVYDRLISRDAEFYSARKLGAFASDLEAVTCFFETPWCRVLSVFNETDQAWLLNIASFSLQSLGRLREAVEPMRVGLKMCINSKDWELAAIHCSNLTLLELSLGKVAEAVKYSEECVVFADRSGEEFQRKLTRAIRGDTLNQSGHRSAADISFREAEQIQAKYQPCYPFLYAVAGFFYSELILVDSEIAAWRRTLDSGRFSPTLQGNLSSLIPHASRGRLKFEQTRHESPHLKPLSDVSNRATQVLKWAATALNVTIIDIALTKLALGRAILYATILSESELLLIYGTELKTTLAATLDEFRRANQQEYLPQVLLTRAWQRFISELHVGPESAQEDLNEAWEIAERGPMRLCMADIHLYRARLFFREKEYPWESPRADLEAAEKLINECGYHRRDEELADAKRVILGRSA